MFVVFLDVSFLFVPPGCWDHRDWNSSVCRTILLLEMTSISERIMPISHSVLSLRLVQIVWFCVPHCNYMSVMCKFKEHAVRNDFNSFMWLRRINPWQHGACYVFIPKYVKCQMLLILWSSYLPHKKGHLLYFITFAQPIRLMLRNV